jgi:hypothetical protein
MKFYKDENNEIYAIEEGATVKSGLVEITEQDKNNILEKKQKELENSPEVINSKIFAELDKLDKKSVRALRENNTEMLNSIEAQAAELRKQIVKVDEN